VEAARSFGEDDDVVVVAHAGGDLLDRARCVLRRLGRAGAIDQDRVENTTREVASNAATIPVVGAGYGASARANLGRQRRPDDDEVEMAGVIREIHTLSHVG